MKINWPLGIFEKDDRVTELEIKAELQGVAE